ncbi:MAG: NAD(P)(+) transhydrogenase (Re/Si-specific) subunit beta [Saprospiraceae bacterium]|nr:NAD(P)(+) transhydrogenase (Re/Si-specific) subunit beta [Saprospiraceae bacterium]MCB9322667.1 NAD(P)(+) transhydrogenase (Re/Si-specific) subunit beta [Lewinellaceae bacterium]
MAYDFFINLGYLVGAVGFVWGLRLLSSPDTARRGNILAGIGMGLAILSAMLAPMAGASNNYGWILGGMVVGGIIGAFAAKKVKMTDMPQMVSVFNGLGGACAVLLASVELMLVYKGGNSISSGPLAILLSTILIGGVTFTGSMLAYAKLQGLLGDNKLLLPMHSMVNNVLLLIILAFGIYMFTLGGTAGVTLGIIFLLLSLIYGASFVIPIGGADMPVVISLLNSFSGISAAAAGLIYGNNIMLVGGILVGASGTILTVLMCEAMNRSLLNVLIGGFGGGGASSKGADGEQVAKEVSLSDAAIQLFYSQSVVIVPGYGLAVAQAQKVCKEVEDLLTANGVEVRYGIHPVAGRMPGHMNVLLAEADVPYDKLLDLEATNSALKTADFAIIVGANDVVNPAALDDPGSPIYGMPVLEVWNAKHVIVLKRSMSAGYAGIQNPLFFHDKNRMLFGDAKATLSKLANELKDM